MAEQTGKMLTIGRMTTAFVAYGIGSGSMFLFDILIVSEVSDPIVARWASLKASLFLFATLCVFGLDRIVLRYPFENARVTRLLLVQIPFFSLVALLIADQLHFLTLSWQVLFSLIFLAFVNYSAAHSRSILRFTDSQISAHGWKFGLLFFLLIVHFRSEEITWNAIVNSLVTALFLSLCIIVLRHWIAKTPSSVTKPSEQPLTTREMYSLGLRFFLLMLTFNASISLEQILLNADQRVTDSAFYFAHTSLCLPLSTMAAGFIGFIIAPLFRQFPEKSDATLSKFFVPCILLAVVMACASAVIGATVVSHWINRQDLMDSKIVIVVGLIGFLRLIYTLPSSYIVTRGTSRDISVFLAAAVTGLVVFISCYLLISRLSGNFLLAIIIGTLSNWILRNASGFWLVWRIKNSS